MSRKYKFKNPEGLYFVTFATEGWTDVFIRNDYKNILVDNLAYCQKNKGLEIFAWCIMTNHVHLMVRATEGHLLQEILRDFKKFTSKTILKAIADNQRESRKEWLLKQFITPDGNRFWRSDNKPIELWSNAAIDQKLNYIHQNPVEEGLVFRAEDYVYSSANDYAGGHGLLDIVVIQWVLWWHGLLIGLPLGSPRNPRQRGILGLIWLPTPNLLNSLNAIWPQPK